MSTSLDPVEEEQEPPNALIDFMLRYGPEAGPLGPGLLVREVFGADPDPWQDEAMEAYAAGERYITIKACHGPGKTCVAAWIVWHHLLCLFPQKSIATAPSKGQLEDALVAEILRWYDELPPVIQELFEMKKNRIELKAAPAQSFFSASTARPENPEALQGKHSKHMLLLADEASGVPEPIFAAAAGSMSGHNATTLLLGNPVRGSGFFFNTFNKAAGLWHCITVSAASSPRVTDEFVTYIATTYGEESNEYRIRVLGEFPLADQNTVIPIDYIRSAMEREIFIPKDQRVLWGVDVARFGDDKSALVKRSTIAVAPDIKTWGGANLMETARKIKNEWDETPLQQRPTEILVDVIGLGAGVVDRLQEWNLPVRGVNVSETASQKDKYRNLRTELWYLAREWLMTKDHSMPMCEGGCKVIGDQLCVHEQLASELSMPRYDYTPTGKLFVEPKSMMKKRGEKSPNIADALMMTFAGDAATMVHGSGDWAAVGWRTPVSRGLSHV